MRNDRYLTIEDLEKIEHLEELVALAEKLFYEKIARFRNGEISNDELCRFTDDELNVRLQYRIIKNELLKDYNFSYLPYNS